MKRVSLAAFFCFCFSFQLSFALSPIYSACQLQKPSGESALIGCPEGTIYVSPTDPYANFTRVQEAINSLPESGDAVILIGKGQYYEAINITRPAPLTLLGQLDPTTAFVAAGNASQRNTVLIWNSRCHGMGFTDEETATLTLTPANYQPFGSVDFKAYNIGFENRGCDPVSQSLVTSFTYSNASFYGCFFASSQDTWYTGFGANTYAVDCIVYGITDYVFGCGIAWFQSVTLANRGCGGALTAWQGTFGEKNGVYIADSCIIRSPDASAATVTNNSCYLGRPWNDQAVAVFYRTYMDDSIRASGFSSWSGGISLPDTVYYAEFESRGPGGNTSARAAQVHILSAAEAAPFTVDNVFGGKPSWIDTGYQYSGCMH